uniref:glycosyltransferase n=1 Tax=Thermogutta sp. TaxID=1962930 RepID=UPI0032208275
MTETLPSSQPSLRVTVVQIGARRNYAVPIALQQAGMLERFFTDWYGPKSFFTKLSGSVSAVIPWKALKRAKARQASELPLEKVVHFPTFALAYNWRKAAASRKGAKAFAYIWGGREFCTRVLSYGLPSCDAVFCFSSVAKELFEAVSGKRLLRVLDQGIPPLAYDDRLVREQETAYPEWCLPRSVESGVEEYTERQRQEWHAADLILCPSTFCRRALVAERAPTEKIEMLPFGIHPKFFVGERSRATNGRTFTVLFVANTPVRKGLPDLVVALERLKGKSIEAFVIGSYTDLTPYALQRTQRVARVLGNVPRPSMPEWYRKADVLVLPTVSDTFGAVVL